MPKAAQEVYEVKISGCTDDVYLDELAGTEEISRPFQYVIKLLSSSRDLNGDGLLGKHLTLIIRGDDNATRYLGGIITNFTVGDLDKSVARYLVVVRPWLWLLTRTTNCRIFQEMSAIEIVEKIFKDENNFTDFRKSLTKTYPKRTYCVQYRESDFDFVSRLLEEEGVSYFFDYEDGKHTLVLSDSSRANANIMGGPDVPFREPGEADVTLEHVQRWRANHEIQPGASALNDFDFEKPLADILVNTSNNGTHDFAAFEIYDYPGKYKETKDGTGLAKVRLQEHQHRHRQFRGSSDARGMSAGRVFKLTEYPVPSVNVEYLITHVRYTIQSGENERFDIIKDNQFYVQITAAEKSNPYVPLRLTPRPLIRGPQTAMVVGKKGKEIWTDKYGRVKLKFPWDRAENKDENSSCWIRVSQHWAGKNWGAMHLPRMGQEVIVEFEEGDPDRPIVTGRVYNADQMPPYKLPDNQTQSGLLTRSTKEGNTKTFNELRFEDKKDSEQIYFHAEKDFDRVVENNDTLQVGMDAKEKSKDEKGKQVIDIWNNRTETVHNGDETVTIKEGARLITVETGDDTHDIKKGHRTVNVDKGDDTHNIKTGNRTVTIDKGDDSLTIKAGDQTIKIDAGKMSTEAATSIELKVGGSSIKIEPAKITLTSKEIAISGDIDVSVSAATVNVEGSGTTNVKGGVVKIN